MNFGNSKHLLGETGLDWQKSPFLNEGQKEIKRNPVI